MRWIAIFACILLAGAGAAAEERPILQLDTGGHMALIRSIAFTPDGRQLVSASDDKTIRVWDLATAKTVRTIRGESAPGDAGKVYAMALSPDGKWLAAGGWTHPECVGRCGEIRLYEFASGKLVALLKGHTNVVLGLSFSPDGSRLISGSLDHTAILWDSGIRAGVRVAEPKLLHRLEGHKAVIYAVGFSPDGSRAVTGSGNNDLRLWRVADGKELAHMTGHGAQVYSLAVAPDGIVASGDWSGEIRLWEARDGRFLRILARQEGTRVGSLSFSPDGKLLLSGNAAAIGPFPLHVYDIATGKEMATYTGHDNTVYATAFSPDGRWAATGGGDNEEIHLWDPHSGKPRPGPDGKPLRLAGQGQPVWAAGFSADGRRIGWGNAWRDTTPILIYGPLEQALTLPLGEGALGAPIALSEAEAVAFRRAQASFGGFSLSHKKGGAFGYDAILNISKDGHAVASIARDGTNGWGHRSYSFTPDGETVISGGVNGFLTAYDRAGNKLGDFVGHEGDVMAVAPSPDGRFLVSGAADQTVRLWNLKTRELLVTLFRGADGEWVMWTPEGFYTGSPGADNIVGWQINRGPEKEARYITAGQLRKALHRPDLVAAKIAGDPDGLVKAAAAKLDVEALLKNSLAPQVAILSPQNGASGKEFSEGGSTRVRIAVAARVTDTGGGIGRIVFKLNGQVVSSAYGAGRLDRDGIISRNFDLATADTVIEAVAEDADGKVESLPASVTVHADAKALQSVPDLYVLAIAANRYRDVSKKLNFAVPDASDVAGTLQEAGAGFYRHAPIVKTLFDGEVTAEKAGAAFADLAGKVQATDVFVLYMAGHGKTIDGDYYFLPPAMDGFSDDAIKRQGFGPGMLPKWLETIQAQKTILIFDTCESGSAGNMFRARDAAADEAAYQRMKETTGRTLFMAAGDQQSAIEGYHNHGVFTYALLEGLAKAGNADKVLLFDLADYVQTRVPQLSRELNACEAKGPDEYCQKPKVPIGSANFPIVPRYPAILAKLGADAPQIGKKPTHAVLAAADLFEAANRGAAVKRQLKRGEQVTEIKAEGGWAYIAKDGKALGYVEEDKLLPLSE